MTTGGVSSSPEPEHDVPAVVLRPSSVPAGDAKSSSKRMLPWALAALALIAAGASILALRSLSTKPVAAGHFEPMKGVACLGRIEPADGVRVIGARSLSGQPSLVSELRVREGDGVRIGQILAVQNSNAELDAALRQAHANLELARTRLEQVKAGAKAGDLAAQRAEVARTDVELQNAQVQYRRAEALYDANVLSKAELDLRRADKDAKAEMFEQAKEKLQSLAEVRLTDIDVAQAQVAAAVAEEEHARAELDASVVRSPIAGKVIKINAWPGEEVGARGIMEIADTARMYIIAEVPDTLIAQVKPGYRAIVSSDGLGTKLPGTVEQVATQVGRNQLVYTDVAALSDARVVEVKILLRDPKLAEHLIHAQARVLIQPE